MYKITKINIQGFKEPSRNVIINFSNEPVSVVFGDNGCGKTTLLKVIYAVISQNNSILLNENVKKVDLFYTIDGGINEKKATVWRNEEIEEFSKVDSNQLSFEIEPYNWSEFNRREFKEASSILFGTSRGISSSSVSISPDIIIDFLDRGNYSRDFRTRSRMHNFAFDLSDYLRKDRKRRRDYNYTERNAINLKEEHLSLDSINMESIQNILIERYSLAKRVTNERVQKALFDTLSMALSVDKSEIEEESGLPEGFSDLITSNKDRLVEALTSSPVNALRDQLIKVLKSEKNFSQLNNTLLPSLLLKMTMELQSEKAILNSIDTLENVFNDHLLNGKKLIVNQDGVLIQIKNKFHSLSELSSGEKHLLSLLTLFIIEGSKRSFLLIDEPEISLNIKWQRRLLLLLNDLAPDSQIIVASHSPSMSMKNTNFLVEMK
ncbi:AAA family ATPase [Paenibacillus polymyxa]|uniref:AAA family ATPase n=1 Tax=Paenibacillus polymyxa TaxID=1406 RepID=UPI002AB59514|nr:AAA family ATPase [Paenibacillus polymyxa]MDY8025155.1 AAA family ATPase [Paenibacillus polymyxa]